MNNYKLEKYYEEHFTKDESIHYVVMGSGVQYEQFSSLNIHEWLKNYNCEKLSDLNKISSKTVIFHVNGNTTYSLYVIDNIILCDRSSFCSDEHGNLIYIYELEKKLDNVLELEKMIKEMKNDENARLLIIWNYVNNLENEEIKYRLFKDYWNRKIYKNSIYIRDYDKSNEEKNYKEYIISENDRKILELLIENNWIIQLQHICRNIENITGGELTYKDLHQKIYRREDEFK